MGILILIFFGGVVGYIVCSRAGAMRLSFMWAFIFGLVNMALIFIFSDTGYAEVLRVFPAILLPLLLGAWLGSLWGRKMSRY